MQAFSPWTPPAGVLGRIVAEAIDRARALEPRRAELERAASRAPAAPGFRSALLRDDVSIIAEVKKRSPSRGPINPGLNAAEQGARYAEGGAAALSILTEPAHFGGSAADLESTRGAVRIPLLKKDFHVSPLQLLEARALGASAALLIARALSPADLEAMVRAADALGLETLIEVRDEAELERALAAGGAVIGVNNRNLETLEIDADTGLRLVPLMPPGVVRVFESGVRDRADVERAAAVGADAVLVGSSISAARDPVGAVRALTGVARRR